MTTAISTFPNIASGFVNGLLSIKPLANFAKRQARNMIIKRAEKIGVPWRQRVQELRTHDWDSELAEVQNPQLTYPEYYLCSFHAYEKGNLSWDAALEVEVASYAVHAQLCPEDGTKGDAKLRQSYHDIVKSQVQIQPQDILDLGCSVGLSTFALQNLYPSANVMGVDLSPYYIAVAGYNSRERNLNINWKHAAAESTGLPDTAFDLVSACLMFHELPQAASKQIFREARRLLRPGGYLTIMDMNPKSEIYANMQPYILTLLKSTEPYLDEYFTLDIEQELVKAGFHPPRITRNSPRHRTVVAQAK
ncbi:class I SAM-dependent methyltransferase [Allocoleopsis sp.]|uniref:class I SAM-dependent methyltransferase n=1 Tax=Allocoleopsis sp. TaxID=3088169 RepID=UPI002FD4A3B1